MKDINQHMLVLTLKALLILLSTLYINAEINWNGNTWAENCDFPGNDLKNIPNTVLHDCEPKCQDTTGCSHYTWLSDTCSLKTGEVFVQDAIETNDGKVCGYTQSTPEPCINMWDIPESDFEENTVNMCAGIYLDFLY